MLRRVTVSTLESAFEMLSQFQAHASCSYESIVDRTVKVRSALEMLQDYGWVILEKIPRIKRSV
jgi:hypothetical protein